MCYGNEWAARIISLSICIKTEQTNFLVNIFSMK